MTDAERRADQLEVELALERTDAEHEIADMLSAARRKAQQIVREAEELAAGRTSWAARERDRIRQETEQRAAALRDAAKAQAARIIADSEAAAAKVRATAAAHATEILRRHEGQSDAARQAIEQVVEDGEALAAQINELSRLLDQSSRTVLHHVDAARDLLSTRLTDAHRTALGSAHQPLPVQPGVRAVEGGPGRRFRR